MQTFVCNKCFQRFAYNKKLQFHIKSCGHFLCENCILPECPICKRNCNSRIVCEKKHPSVLEYFGDPNKIMKHYQQTIKFQCEQQARNNAFYFKTLPALIKKQKTAQSGFIKMEHRMKSQIDIEKQKIAKLKKYIAYHERRLEQPMVMAAAAAASQSRSLLKRIAAGSEASTSIHTPSFSSDSREETKTI